MTEQDQQALTRECDDVQRMVLHMEMTNGRY